MIKQRKRFVDSALLNAGFYLKLNPAERLFWMILQLKCDAIGQFEMEGELLYAERMHGLDIDPEELIQKVNSGEERLRGLGKGRYFLTQFIREQYGKLNPSSPPRKRYLDDLFEAGLWETFKKDNPDLCPSDDVLIGYGYPIDTLEEEEKEKEEEKEQESEKAQEKEFKVNSDLKAFKEFAP